MEVIPNGKGIISKISLLKAISFVINQQNLSLYKFFQLENYFFNKK